MPRRIPHTSRRTAPPTLGLSLVLAMLCAAGVAWACPPLDAAAPVVRLAPCHRQLALQQIEQIINTHYVFVEKRAPIIEKLRKSQRQHRYEVSDPELLVERVNQDLQEISHDGHLYLKHNAQEYAAALAPPSSDAGMESFRKAQATRMNHGLVELRILSGNVRYLKLASFQWVGDGSSARAYDAAARFLAEGDAILVDLRGNGGGQSEAADYFLEHIVGANARARGVTSTGTSPGKPLYLLIDNDVGSAAEAVAYDAKLRKTAILVGATTFGAANNNKRFPIAPRFILSVSYHRPVHPLSGTNWEGTGVSPDVAVPAAEALDAAFAEALRLLYARAGASDPMKAAYAWSLAAVEARLRRPAPSAELLRSLQGKYGPIELRYQERALRLYRPDRPRWPQGALLIPMTEDGLFALAETDELRIRVQPGYLEILRPSAAPEKYGAAGSAAKKPPRR